MKMLQFLAILVFTSLGILIHLIADKTYLPLSKHSRIKLCNWTMTLNALVCTYMDFLAEAFWVSLNRNKKYKFMNRELEPNIQLFSQLQFHN